MVYRVRANWTGAPVTGPAVSTFFFADDVITAQAASNHVSTFLGNLDAVLSTQLTWTTEPEVDTLDTTTGILQNVTSVTTATGTGSNAADPLPRTTQGLARWGTGQIISGRALKGHMFIPGFCEDNNTNGNVAPATVTGVNTALSNFVTAAAPHFVIWSRTHGTSRPVVTSSLWSQWAYLSSRRD